MRNFVKQPNRIKEWFTRKLQGLIYRLDNTGNGDLHVNGEKQFIKKICETHKNKDFVLFDVGGNRGDYTDFVLKYIKTKNKQIHIFEPQQSCVSILEKKFSSVNGIYINSFALSNENRKATMFKDFDQSGLASLHKRNLEHYSIKTESTEEITLKNSFDYIEEKRIKKIDLLKLDVEGHELKVLEGFGSFLNPENVSLIQFEYGGANLDSHTSLMEIFSFLRSRGYQICKIMPKHIEIREYHPRLENFMYANYVAMSPKIKLDENN